MELPDLTKTRRAIPQPSTGNVSVNLPGPGSMQAVGAAVHDLGDTLMQQSKRISTLQAEDAYTKLKNWQLDQTSGQNGFLNLKGEAAINGPKLADITKGFDDQVNQLSTNLNPQAQEMFKERADISRLQLNEDYMRHQVRESNVWAAQVVDNSIQSEANNVAANWNNENAIGSSIARVNALIDEHAKDPYVGWSKSQTDQAKSEAMQKLETSRWMAWAIDDPVGAYDNFKKNKNLIKDGPTRLRLDSQLNGLAQPVQGANLASEAMNKFTGKPVLTGEGTGTGMAGFTGDPQAIANELSDALANPNINPETIKDVQAAQAQLKRQMNAPGGMALPNMKTDVYSKYGQMLDYIQKKTADDQQLQQHAISALNSQMTNIVRSHDLAVNALYQTIIKEIPLDGSVGPTSIAELSPAARNAFASLDPQQQRGVLSVMHESAAIARGDYIKSNPAMFNQLLNRIYLPQGDPNRIRSRADLLQYQQDGGINYTDFTRLGAEIDRAATPEGNRFGSKVYQVKENAHNQLLRNYLSKVDPAAAEEASYRFNADLDAKIEQYRKEGKEGKDPSILFDPGTPQKPNPEYVLNPSRVASYLPSKQKTVSSAAQSAMVQSATQEPKLPTIKNDAEFNALKSGTRFIAPDGTVRTKP